MDLYIDIIICPACKTEHECEFIRICNTGHTTYYSDGDMTGPHYGKNPSFTICVECKQFFKISNDTIADYKDFDTERPYAKFLTIRQMRKAIKHGLVNGGDQGSEEWMCNMINLRIDLWWELNKGTKKKADYLLLVCDIFQKLNIMENLTIKFKSCGVLRLLNEMWEVESDDDEYIDTNEIRKLKRTERRYYNDNCRKLLNLLEYFESDEDFLMCAELRRNIGEYDMCESVLRQISEPEKYRPYILAIRSACEKRISHTVRIDRQVINN